MGVPGFKMKLLSCNLNQWHKCALILTEKGAKLLAENICWILKFLYLDNQSQFSGCQTKNCK